MSATGWSTEYAGRFAAGQSEREVRQVVRSLTYRMSAKPDGGRFGGLVELRNDVARGELTLPGSDRADSLVLIAEVVEEHEAAWDVAIGEVSQRHLRHHAQRQVALVAASGLLVVATAVVVPLLAP